MISSDEKMFLGEVIMTGKGFYVIYEELVTLQQASVTD